MDDVVIEPEDAEGGEVSLQGKLKELKQQLKKVQDEKAEYLEGWQRSKADYVNAKKRAEEEREMMIKTAGEAFILDIIPVLDSFEHALSHNSLESEVGKGIHNTYSQLVSVLSAHGVQMFDPKGELFDPSKHEAVKILDVSDESADNTVITVFQKGYLLRGKIIRPARVEIGHYQSKA